MQAVISRVHRIVTTHASGDADSTVSRSADASPHARSPLPQQSASAAALSSLGVAATPPPLSITIPSPTPQAIAASSSSLTPSGQHSSTAHSPAASTPQSQTAATTVAASQSPPAVPAAVKHEIQLAVEQLQYATLLSERKKAVQALHTLARSYAASPRGRGSERTPQQPRGTPAHRALGDASMPVVLNALVSDPRDTELMEAMLELLQDLVTGSPATATALIEPMHSSASRSSSAFALVNANSAPSSGVQICLELLQDPSPWIRGPTITLVKHLQEASQRAFAASVLECKEGLRRLLEVVADKREHIRDAALQVLVKLTERETMVQQFLAFEDGFTHLFQIMEAEGLVDGSSVISDCLQIVNNMVRNNVMTQTLLRETPFLESHVPQLLRLPRSGRQSTSGRADHSTTNGDDNGDDVDGDAGVTTTKSYQKRRALKLGLQLVRFLVAGLYEGVPDAKLDEVARRDRARKDAELAQIQSFIGRQSALMGAIGELACCESEELTDLQLQALDLLELLGCSNVGNQIILVHLQSWPSHRSVLSEFVRLDFAEDESPVSAAATLLLDSLFRNNETTKMAIFQQLNAPPPIDDDDFAGGGDDSGMPVSPAVPAGRVLLDAVITNSEAIVTGSVTREHALRTATIVAWKASHRLAALLASSEYCKDLALRIPSAYDQTDAQAVPGGRFFTRCLRVLGPTPSASANQAGGAELRASVFQVRVAVLTLLIQWCAQCTKAVHEVVASVANLSILIELFGKESDYTSSRRDAAEGVHVRGLVALLLGCCLEFLVDPKQLELEQLHAALPLQSSGGSSAAPSGVSHTTVTTASGGTAMTCEQLLETVSKRIGLQRFTDALVQFQQAPLVVACARASKSHSARNLLPPRSLYSDAASGLANGGNSADNSDDVSSGSYLFALYEKAFITAYRELADRIQRRVIAIYTCAGVGEHVGGGGGAAPHAMSAYQDLIRIQDKQIQDMDQQLRALRAASQAQQQESSATTSSLTGSGGSGDDIREAVDAARREAEAEFNARLKELERTRADERVRLEDAVKTLEAAAVERETRYSGLSAAFEQLEADYHMRNNSRSETVHHHIPSPTLSTTMTHGSSSSGLAEQLNVMTERCHSLEHELCEEKQLRVQGERHASLDRSELEMYQLELQKTIETQRMALAQRDEQLRETSATLEAVEAAQAVLKRENASLKEQIALGTTAVGSGAGADAGVASADNGVHRPPSPLTVSQSAGESLSTELDALRKELASKHAELELARETQRELERQVVRKLQRSDCAAPATAASGSRSGQSPPMTSMQHQAARVVEQLKQHSVARELFSLLDAQQERELGLTQSLEHAQVNTRELEQQYTQSRAECAALETQLQQAQHDYDRMETEDHDVAAAHAAREDEIARLQALIATQRSEMQELRSLIESTEQQRLAMIAKAGEARRNEQKRIERVVASLCGAAVDAPNLLLEADAADPLAQLETAVAHLLDMKRELEQQVATHSELNGSAPPDSTATTSSSSSMSDDALILLASLEIHCATLREGLRAAQGEAAVAAAAVMARQRGAALL